MNTWVGATGGVTANDYDNNISYSGTPTGWLKNTVNSAPLTLFGATNEYSVAWIVGNATLGNVWVVGLGVAESGPNWRDIDYAFRVSANGRLEVRHSGTWMRTITDIAAGDKLAIAVSGTVLEYRLNGVTVYTTAIAGGEDFYIDTSFNTGAINLTNFFIEEF